MDGPQGPSGRGGAEYNSYFCKELNPGLQPIDSHFTD
jgi:hypothetical protein